MTDERARRIAEKQFPDDKELQQMLYDVLMNEATSKTETKKQMGFTDRLALVCVAMLTVGLLMAFTLSVMSIRADYNGALACFTVVFTPIGTMLGIVLTAVVNKNRAENTSATEGINVIKARGPDI